MCKRALVVDDNPGIRCELSNILGQFGFEVFTATNEKEAINAVDVEQPDVVFVDENLKNSIDDLGLKVIQVISSLVGAERRTVILMSLDLDCSEKEKERLGKKGIHIDGLLSKPFTIEDVKNIL